MNQEALASIMSKLGAAGALLAATSFVFSVILLALNAYYTVLTIKKFPIKALELGMLLLTFSVIVLGSWYVFLNTEVHGIAMVVVFFAAIGFSFGLVFVYFVALRPALDELSRFWSIGWMSWARKHADEIAKLPDTFNSLYVGADYKHLLRVPEGLRHILTNNYTHWLLDNRYPAKDTIKEIWTKATVEERKDLFPLMPNIQRHANAVNHLMELVPAHGLIVSGEDNSLFDYLQPTLAKAGDDDKAHPYYLSLYELGNYRDHFKGITVSIQIPDALRTEHMQVLANPGHGKTTLLTQMFFDDLKTDAGIVLIDSQGDLINELAARVPADRLILIDPQTCPPALNMFARKIEGEQGINNALSLYEYIFGSLGVSMSGKQEMVYRYLSRLCMMIPGGSLRTLRDMLQTGGTEDYQDYINQMNDNAQAFFREFQQAKNNDFNDTRQQVLNRLLKVLESDTFALMFGADGMTLDIPAALAEGKVILVSTAKNFLGDGASLLGRVFVAQVMQAVRNRSPGDRRRVYLYIDEFADYAQDSSILLDCFAQGRKYELGMIVAHQNLDQLTERLAATVSSSTAIKFAGGISAEDARRVASQMRTKAEEIDRQPKGTFLAYFKDIGTIPWKVKLGFIDTVPRINDVYAVQEDMRRRYGATKKAPPQMPPKPMNGSGPEVDGPDGW